MSLFDVIEAMKTAEELWDQNRDPLRDLKELLKQLQYLEYEGAEREPDEGIPAPPGRRIRLIPGRVSPGKYWLRWYPSGFA